MKTWKSLTLSLALLGASSVMAQSLEVLHVKEDISKIGLNSALWQKAKAGTVEAYPQTTIEMNDAKLMHENANNKAKKVRVKTIQNGEYVAFLVQWKDTTKSIQEGYASDVYGDGFAIQLPTTLDKLPYIGMGSDGRAVIVHLQKATGKTYEPNNNQDVYHQLNSSNQNAFAGERRIRLESVQNANDQALTVAKMILSQKAEYKTVPWFWTDQGDIRLQMTGLSFDTSDYVIRGDMKSGRFSVLDRTNMNAIKNEAQLKKVTQNIKGARYVITGDVTEFGRKEVGDHQLFGLLGRGKSQVAYAKVALNVVDVKTSEVVYSAQGAGEYSLSNREVVGFGSTASYDSTLNGKVLDLAIREAVDNLVGGVESGALRLAD